MSDLLILICSVVVLYAHWVSGNEIKKGVSVAKMQKKPDFSIFKFVERPLNFFARPNPSRGAFFYQKEHNFRVKLKIKKWKSNLGYPNTIYFFRVGYSPWKNLYARYIHVEIYLLYFGYIFDQKFCICGI